MIMQSTDLHPVVGTPPAFEQIIRARLRPLLRKHCGSILEARRRVDWVETTLWRRLNQKNGGGTYRRCFMSDIDELLIACGIEPDELFAPVLVEGDAKLLIWTARCTDADPLPSRARLYEAETEHPVALKRCLEQGLLLVHGLEEDPDGHYLRLTSAGQTALR